MTAKPSSTQLFAAGLVLAALLTPMRAGAVEVKKMLPPPGGGEAPAASSAGQSAPQQANPIPAAMRQQLSDTIATESDNYLNEESEKKSSGKPYVDLEHAKFMYLPTKKEGKWVVEAKLEAAEYTLKSGASKPKATGARKVLVFSYRLDGSKWSEVEQPKWEDAEPTESAKKTK
ncbi:MAG TPA: hypothetical protein VIX59_10525 [Candidatus Binataceae bacterium]|jgi:hypothetical protein